VVACSAAKFCAHALDDPTTVNDSLTLLSSSYPADWCGPGCTGGEWESMPGVAYKLRMLAEGDT
jgi:hypothetical protein